MLLVMLIVACWACRSLRTAAIQGVVCRWMSAIISSATVHITGIVGQFHIHSRPVSFLFAVREAKCYYHEAVAMRNITLLAMGLNKSEIILFEIFLLCQNTAKMFSPCDKVVALTVALHRDLISNVCRSTYFYIQTLGNIMTCIVPAFVGYASCWRTCLIYRMLYFFYHATRMHRADYAVARCLSVCPSVTHRYCV